MDFSLFYGLRVKIYMKKICSSCEVEKELDEFVIDRRLSSGFSSTCKECNSRKCKDYYLKNGTKVREKVKEYRANNLEESNKRQKTYRLKNKKKTKENNKNWRKNNKDRKQVSNNRYKTSKLESLSPLHDPKIEFILLEMRTRISKCLKIPFAIDHIYPLNKGGLHHHQNLQVIPVSINSSKRDNLDYRHPSICHWTDLPENVLILIRKE